MEEGLYEIYKQWLQKDVKENKVYTIHADSYVLSLKREGIITREELELVKYEKTNEAKNDKLFLEIMPAKGDKGLKELLKLLEEYGDRGILECLEAVCGRKRMQQKIWGNAPQTMCFVGRQSLIENVKSMFDEKYAKTYNSVVVVLAGLGGVGKTHTAAEFINKYEFGYKRVAWISAKSANSDYMKLADELGIKKANENDTRECVKLWFEKAAPCLIVFDDAENYDQVQPFFPSKGCHILVTSRYKNWPPMNEIAKTIELTVFDKQEAVTYIEKMLDTFCDITAECADITDLSTLLGRLPLALAQACCYIRALLTSISDYVQLFKKREIEFLSSQKLPQNLQKRDENENTIMVTWNITKDAIRERCPLACKLLNVCSYFQCDAIPMSLLKVSTLFLNNYQNGELNTENVSDAVSMLKVIVSSTEDVNEVSLEFSSAVRILTNFSMLSYTVNHKQVSMHCLLQKVVNNETKVDGKRMIKDVAVILLTSYRDPEIATWNYLNQMRLLVQHLNEHLNTIDCWNATYKNDEVDVIIFSKILTCAADGNYAIGQYEAVCTMFRKSINANLFPFNDVGFKKLYDSCSATGNVQLFIEYKKKHETFLSIGNSFFDSVMRQYDKSTPAERSLQSTVFESILDMVHITEKRHNIVPLSRFDKENFIANLTKENIVITFLTFAEKVWNANSFGLNFVADQYFSIGDSAKARTLFERALQLDEERLGKDHPEVAILMTNLAAVYNYESNFEIAKQLLQNAISIEKKVFSDDDSKVSDTLRKLAYVYMNMGEYQNQQEVLVDVRRIQLKYLEPNHPQVIQTLIDIARTQIKLNNLSEARVSLDTSAELLKSNSNQSADFETTNAMIKLGSLYCNVGEMEIAKTLIERAVEIQEKHHGQINVLSLWDLALFYKQLHKMEKCREYLERCIEVYDVMFQNILYEGDRPIRTILICAGLANFKLNNRKVGIQLFERAKQVIERGSTDPDHQFAIAALGLTYASAKKFEQFLDLFQKYSIDSTTQVIRDRQSEFIDDCIADQTLLFDCTEIFPKLTSIMSNMKDTKAARIKFVEVCTFLFTNKLKEHNLQLNSVPELQITDDDFEEITSDIAEKKPPSLEILKIILKWPSDCLDSTLEILQASLLTDSVANALFAHTSIPGALDLFERLCHLAAKGSSEQQLLLLACKVFTNCFAFESGRRCLLMCPTEVADVLLKHCITSDSEEVRNAASMVMANFSLLLTGNKHVVDKTWAHAKLLFTFFKDLQASNLQVVVDDQDNPWKTFCKAVATLLAHDTELVKLAKDYGVFAHFNSGIFEEFDPDFNEVDVCEKNVPAENTACIEFDLD